MAYFRQTGARARGTSLLFPLLATLCLLSGCFVKKAVPATGCEDTSDCGAGFVCVGTACERVCRVPSDCRGALVCATNGICQEPANTPLPAIATVHGNGATTRRIADGLLISGADLQNATFRLDGPMSVSLEVRSQTDAEVEVVLPQDIRSGLYILIAMNEAGSATTPITLELPELDGATIVRKLNASVSTLAASVLPVGEGSNQVARGNHDHAAAYYSRDQLYTKSEVDSRIAGGGTVFTGSHPVSVSGNTIGLVPCGNGQVWHRNDSSWVCADKGISQGAADLRYQKDLIPSLGKIWNPENPGTYTREARMCLLQTVEIHTPGLTTPTGCNLFFDETDNAWTFLVTGVAKCKAWCMN